jgi:alpha-beta hydrolase superfamily lysophospholipase
VLLLHAMMTDARYFGAQRGDGFAQFLAPRGLEVFVAEFRGHGGSTPPRAGERRADWSFDDLVELDLPAVVAAVPPDAAILGHSLGGLVACAAIGTRVVPPPTALVLAATNVRRGETATRRAVMRAFDASARLLGKVPARAIGVGNTDEPPAYAHQLAFTGAGDRLCRPADARDVATRIGSCGALRIVGRAHGDALDADHFTLFTRPELVDLRDWIARALGC